jgi:hypothetical protein
VVLRDDFEERVFEAFARQPPSMSPVAAMRAGMREAVASLTPAEWAEFQEMSALGMAVPEVRARMLDDLARTIDQAAVALAERIGKPPSDLVVRVTAGAVFGVLMAVMEPQAYTEGHIHAAAFERVDEALALLEAGLPS